MANINETFRYIDYSNKDSFIQTEDGRIELKQYSDDLVFYSNFDSTLDAIFSQGVKTPVTTGTIENSNNGKYAQHIKITNGSVKYDSSNFDDLTSEGTLSFYIKTDFNNALGQQSFIKTSNPNATGLPRIDKTQYKYGGGGLDLLGDEEKRIEYDVRNISSMVQIGTIDFFVKTGYDGTPSNNISFFDLYNGTDNSNRITITHEVDGNLHYRMYDQTGALSVHISFAWSADSTAWLNTSLNFDLNSGNTKVFINGTQYGTTSTATATRIAISTGYIGIGSTSTNISNHYIDDVAIFDTVKNTASYSVRNDTFELGETGLLFLARYDLDVNLNTGAYPTPLVTVPTTSDYYFRLSVDGVDYNGDIGISLETTDTMTDVFNKISTVLSGADVNVIQEPEGNITVQSVAFGALIEISSPSSGRDLLQILGGVTDPKLPNGPSTDTTIFDLYNETNNSNRISIIHTTNSRIIVRMWDNSSNLVVDQDCGEWTNWQHYWYKMELDWGESIGQFFLEGNMKSVFTTNFVRQSNSNSLFLNSTSTENYRFDELIIYNTYKHTKNHSLETSELTPYDNSNPYIDVHFGEGFIDREITGIDLNSSAGTYYTVKLGSDWYYYFSGAWRKSDGSFSQSISPSILETKFEELYFSENVELVIRVYFSSDGQTNQWIDTIAIMRETDADAPATIVGTVELTSPVDLSSYQHVDISTDQGSAEVDLTTEVEGTPAETTGNVDLTSGFDWGSSPDTFTIDGTTINLNTTTASLEDIVSLIEPQLPTGYEIFTTEDGHVGFRTTDKTASATLDISGTALNTLGITDDVYNGTDPDLTSVTPQDIVDAINAAGVPGLSTAALDEFGRLVLSSASTGDTAYISIDEGATSNALDIIWGYPSTDSGEEATGPFIDYTIINDWIRSQLGAPIAPVELTDEQIENCISLATYWYNYYRNSKENLIYVQLEGDQKQGYKIPQEVGSEEDILEIIVKPRFPFAYYTGSDVDSIMSNIYMQWMFQRGRHAGFNDFLGDYYITLSTEKDYSIILGTEIRWRFFNGRIFINPAPIGMDIIIVFKSALTIEEINTNTLIREYALGEAKKVLGTIRSTFGGQVPGGAENLTLNGDSLKAEGQEEVNTALEKMQLLMEPFGFDFG